LHHGNAPFHAVALAKNKYCSLDLLHLALCYLKGSHFESPLRHSEQGEDSTEKAFRKLFPAMFPGMVEELNCMYKVRS
jgi:hypothetical protein